jgi:hypothetical protein
MSESVPDTPLRSPSATTLTEGRTGRAGALLADRAGATALPGPGASA